MDSIDVSAVTTSNNDLHAMIVFSQKSQVYAAYVHVSNVTSRDRSSENSVNILKTDQALDVGSFPSVSLAVVNDTVAV